MPPLGTRPIGEDQAASWRCNNLSGSPSQQVIPDIPSCEAPPHTPLFSKHGWSAIAIESSYHSRWKSKKAYDSHKPKVERCSQKHHIGGFSCFQIRIRLLGGFPDLRGQPPCDPTTLELDDEYYWPKANNTASFVTPPYTPLFLKIWLERDFMSIATHLVKNAQPHQLLLRATPEYSVNISSRFAIYDKDVIRLRTFHQLCHIIYSVMCIHYHTPKYIRPIPP
jgi:hypothetical protein